MRIWEWLILTRDRVCVLCGNKIPAATKAIQTTYRGTITLCKKCRERNKEVIKVDKFSEVELFEG